MFFKNDIPWDNIINWIPFNLYTRLLGSVAGLPLPVALRTDVWKLIAMQMGINWQEAELSLAEYPTFQKFFTRRLKPGLRPIWPEHDSIISPVDGCLSEFGIIQHGDLLQAKGLQYTLANFIGDAQLAMQLEGGAFVTLYLRPKDYHRIHCPTSAKIVGIQRIPGNLLPVRPNLVSKVPGLFVQNERLIIRLDAAGKLIVLVAVAAAGVGTVSLEFDKASHGPEGIGKFLQKGDEIAAFNLGSTVVLLFEPNTIALESLQIAQEIQMGQLLAKFVVTTS